MGRSDVVKDEFVGLLRLVRLREPQGVARVTVVFEKTHVLDHAAMLDIQAGNDAFGEHAPQHSRPVFRRGRHCADRRNLAGAFFTFGKRLTRLLAQSRWERSELPVWTPPWLNG